METMDWLINSLQAHLRDDGYEYGSLHDFDDMRNRYREHLLEMIRDDEFKLYEQLKKELDEVEKKFKQRRKEAEHVEEEDNTKEDE